MKKSIKKHIENKNFIKVYISDNEGVNLTHFEGILFAQNDKYILMSDFEDFNYDGFVIVRKSDISEIKRTENEIFFDTILEKEGIKEIILQKKSEINFRLSDLPEMFSTLNELGKAIIIEQLYENKSKFLIGPITKVSKKKVYIDYFNAKGEFDLKPIATKYKDITYFKIDSPYANTFLKYSKKIK
jgi:hypothetical protein